MSNDANARKWPTVVFSSIRRTTVRVTSVLFGIMWTQLKATLNPLEHHNATVLRDLRRTNNWDPIMPTDVKHSYGWWKKSSPKYRSLKCPAMINSSGWHAKKNWQTLHPGVFFWRPSERWGPYSGPPKINWYRSIMMYEGLSGAVPTRWRDARLSDGCTSDHCRFFFSFQAAVARAFTEDAPSSAIFLSKP